MAEDKGLAASPAIDAETMLEIIATMMGDPDGYNSDIRKQLLKVVSASCQCPLCARSGRTQRMPRSQLPQLLRGYLLQSAAFPKSSGISDSVTDAPIIPSSAAEPALSTTVSRIAGIARIS